MAYYIFECEQQLWVDDVDEYMETPRHIIVRHNDINPPDCVKKIDLLFAQTHDLAKEFRTRKEANNYVQYLRDNIARLDYLVCDKDAAKEIDDGK